VDTGGRDHLDYIKKHPHEHTLDMSGGFLGSIPPYFFFTASSYKVHQL